MKAIVDTGKSGTPNSEYPIYYKDLEEGVMYGLFYSKDEAEALHPYGWLVLKARYDEGYVEIAVGGPTPRVFLRKLREELRNEKRLYEGYVLRRLPCKSQVTFIQD